MITVVGDISSVNVGSVITVKGNFTTNKKFGKQFSVTSGEEMLPSDVYGIEKYLGSGLIKGVGPKFAKLIVKTFGSDTLSILEHNPERLLEVPKLGRKKAESIAKSYLEQRDIKNLMMFLSSAGISTSLGQKIFKAYGKESIEKIKENPYRLIDEVYGVGFKTADSIANKLGIDNESFTRCRAGIFYTLEYLANSEGHCYVPYWIISVIFLEQASESGLPTFIFAPSFSTRNFIVSKSYIHTAHSIGKFPFLKKLLMSNLLSIKYFTISKLLELIAELTDIRILSLIFPLRSLKSKLSRKKFYYF